MANRLSNSSINRYLTCARSWELHYREGYRPTELSSALIFGSAIGKAFEYILTKRNDIPTPEGQEQKELTPKEYFDYHWLYQDVNGVLTNLKEYENVTYSKYDLDTDLASTPYESLRVKAHLMIDTFISDLLPQIEHVYSTEEKVELTNEEGDSSIGFADAVVKLKDYFKPVILDFKTAARFYEQNSVVTSVQLAQYLHTLGPKYETRLAGYAVFLKNISKNKVKICSLCDFDGSGSRHKTCAEEVERPRSGSGESDMVRCNGKWIEKISPKAELQILVDAIPETFENFIIDNIASVNDAIKTGIFVKNVSKCLDAGYGRRCEFYNVCHNNTMDGLTKVEPKK